MTIGANETAGRVSVDPRPFQLALGPPLRAAAFVLVVGLLIPKPFHRLVGLEDVALPVVVTLAIRLGISAHVPV